IGAWVDGTGSCGRLLMPLAIQPLESPLLVRPGFLACALLRARITRPGPDRSVGRRHRIVRAPAHAARHPAPGKPVAGEARVLGLCPVARADHPTRTRPSPVRG